MASDKTSLGDRMKRYEKRYTGEEFLPMLPIIARIDGRCFSKFTKGLARPYDERMSKLMVETTKHLVKETHARCGYTQSDEITLTWLSETVESKVFFASKVQKMVSVLASMATSMFISELLCLIPEKTHKLPTFDCRVFQVPTLTEAVNCFIWREKDATRNSVQMAAHTYYSYKQCHKKNSSQLQEMLFEKGVNWNDYPAFFKRGTYVRPKTTNEPLSIETLESIPEKHRADKENELVTRRSIVAEENFPILSKIANREEVIFYGADPVERKDQ